MMGGSERPMTGPVPPHDYDDAATDAVTAALIGNRRAHQYLRLLDLGRDEEAHELLESLDTPAELVNMGYGLASIARTAAAGLSGMHRRKAAQRATELDAMFETHKVSPEHLRTWVVATGAEAARVMFEHSPRTADRVRFYESSARASFDGEEPGSHVRRATFG